MALRLAATSFAAAAAILSTCTNSSSPIENLAELVRTLRGRDLPIREHARALYEIQAVLAEIRGVKKEIKSLDSIFNLFSNDKDEQRARKLLRARIDNLLSQLEQIARRKAST